MANKKHTIEIAGQAVDVPAWASEEQLTELIGIDTNVLKSLNALLKNNKLYTKQVVDSNKDLLSGLEKKADKTSKKTDQNDREQIKTLKQLFSLQRIRNDFAKKQQESDTKAAKDLRDQMGDVAKNLKDVPGKIAKGLNDTSLAGIATAVGGIVGLGGAAGFAVGVLEGFAKNITTLSNSGVGLTIGLQDLRSDAAAAGLNLENYGKIIQSNGRAIRSLGDSTQGGARMFSVLSDELRFAARSMGQFGLSNTEYNEVLAEEIELRRLSGMTQDQITRSVASSMNNLMAETTALANLTGRDRRDMLRDRAELMNNEVIVNARNNLAAMGQDLPEAFNSLSGILGGMGDIGAALTQAVAESATTGIPVLSTAAGRAISEQLSVAGLTDEAEQLAAFFKTAYDTDMPMEQASAGILEIVNNMRTSTQGVTADNLSNLAALGGDAQRQVLGFVQNLNGLANLDAEGIGRVIQETLDGLEDNAGVLGTASAMEEAANNINASAVNSAFNVIGVELTDAGNFLTGKIRDIGDNFGGDTGLVEGARGAFGDGIVNLTIGIAALTAATTALTAVMAGRGAMALGRRGARGMFGSARNPSSRLSRFFGSGAASQAAANGAGRLGQAGAAASSILTGQAGAAALGGGSGMLGRAGAFIGRAAVPLTIGIGALQAGSALMNDDLDTTEKSEAVGSAVGGAGGAVGGALAGAAIGSVVPVIGTAIGGIVGGIVGGLGGNYLGGAVGEYVGENMLSEDLQGDISETNTEIQELQSRIQRSLEGQNEYWGRENKGREESAEEIIALQANLQQLRENAAEILTVSEQVNIDNFSRAELYSLDRDLAERFDQRRQEIIREANESGDRINSNQATLAASREFADEINNAFDRQVVTITEQSVMRDAAAVEALDAAIDANRSAVTAAENILNPDRLPTSGLDSSSETPEPVEPAPAVQSSTILGYHDKLERDAEAAQTALENFQQQAGELEVIGTEFDPLEGTDVDVMGYKDQEKQQEYERLRAERGRTNRLLGKTERDKRYQIARARELAEQMGMENPEDIKFTSRGHVPVQINGQAVDSSLYSERERASIGAAERLSDAMNNRPSLTPMTTDAVDEETVPPSTNNRNNITPSVDTMTKEQGDILIRTLQENNRLLRKGNDTAEMNN